MTPPVVLLYGHGDDLTVTCKLSFVVQAFAALFYVLHTVLVLPS